jgi:hypothetical protein
MSACLLTLKIITTVFNLALQTNPLKMVLAFLAKIIVKFVILIQPAILASQAS